MSNNGRSSPAPQSTTPRPAASIIAPASAAANQLSSSPAGSFRGRSYGSSVPRSDATARLAAVIPSAQAQALGTSPAGSLGSGGNSRRPSAGRRSPSGMQTPLAGRSGGPGASVPSSGPGVSALAAALSNSVGTSPPLPLPRLGTPPNGPPLGLSDVRAPSPAATAHLFSSTPLTTATGGTPTNYGSFESRPRYASTSGAFEDPEIVRRHLVQRSEAASISDRPAGDYKGKQAIGGLLASFFGGGGGDGSSNGDAVAGLGTDTDSVGGAVGASGIDEDEFSSLQLQGGDMTRTIYKWTEEATKQVHRTKSFSQPRPEPESEVLDIHTIKVPGGFRRNYLRRAAEGSAQQNYAAHGSGLDGYHQADTDCEAQPGPSECHQCGHDEAHYPHPHVHRPPHQPTRLFTASFLEFLSIYGHFAGEELEEDDEVLKPGEYFSSGDDEAGEEQRLLADGGAGGGGSGGGGSGGGSSRGDSGSESDDDDDREPMEDSTLLTPSVRRRRRQRKTRGGSGKASPMGAAVVLLKSFVGTGVLFLPRAYLSGGMLFSNVVLLGVAALSYYCFVLLVTTRLKVVGSFGDIGGVLYGRWLRFLILTSIVISQIGFVAAYIVFTSENLQAVIRAVSNCEKTVPIKYLILVQMVIFLPFSLLRDINKLGFTALVADAFIVIGLAYLFYYDVATLSRFGLADIELFNPRDWTLFIGTAIFTFEGIGLIIPIQESMRHPQKFPRVMFAVMIIITTLFIVMGAVSYAAYGSKTETVVLLNLPQDNRLVNGVQFLYSLAILLSTPLQIFPAIRITENGLFTRSGKYNPYIKWQKNLFRFVVVAACAAIAWGGADSLDKFVALVGNFACIPLVYIYPPMLHYRAVARSRLWKASDVLLCMFGLVAMVYTTSLTIMNWASSSSAPKLPGYCDSRLPSS